MEYDYAIAILYANYPKSPHFLTTAPLFTSTSSPRSPWLCWFTGALPCASGYSHFASLPKDASFISAMCPIPEMWAASWAMTSVQVFIHVPSHIWNLCRHLQEHVHTPTPCLPLRPAFLSLLSVSWSDTILLGIQAKNNVVPYLSSPASWSSATWIPSLFLKPWLPWQGCLYPSFVLQHFLSRLLQ